jgi:hypothetical protein
VFFGTLANSLNLLQLFRGQLRPLGVLVSLGHPFRKSGIPSQLFLQAQAQIQELHVVLDFLGQGHLFIAPQKRNTTNLL